MIRRQRDDERGFAMIVSMVVATVGIVLVTAMLAQGVHLLEASSYDRRWNNSLQAAEAGVERTVVELAKNATIGGLGLTTVPFGQFETTVTTPAVGYRVITSTGYAAAKGAAKASKRRIVVRYGPVPTFKYALFSGATMDLQNINNNCVTGDAFANQTITVGQNACVRGSVVSATGAVLFANGGQINKKADGTGGDVFSGGLGPDGVSGIALSNGVDIFGAAHAQRESCPGLDPHDKYRITGAGGTVHGDAWADGSIAAAVLGTPHPNGCQLSRPTEPMPTFRVDQIDTLYGGPVTRYTSVASFNTYVAAHRSDLRGLFYVTDPRATAPVDLGNVTVTGTLVLVTDALIDTGNSFEIRVADPANDYVDIISLNPSASPPAIDVKNTFTVSGNPKPPVLIYSEGLIDVKNSADSNGAVYAGRLSVKNNVNVTYDSRVERTLGFGPSRFGRISWTEVPAS